MCCYCAGQENQSWNRHPALLGFSRIFSEAQFQLCCLRHPLPHETGPSAFTRWGQRSCPVCSEESPPPCSQLPWGQWSFCLSVLHWLACSVLNASLPRGCVDGGSGLAETHQERWYCSEGSNTVSTAGAWRDKDQSRVGKALLVKALPGTFRKTLWAEYVFVEESYLYETISPMIIKAVQIQYKNFRKHCRI